MPDPILYEIDEGFVVIMDGRVLVSERSEAGKGVEPLKKIGEEIKRRGIGRIKVSSLAAQTTFDDLGVETSIITDEEREQLDSMRSSILSDSGLLGEIGGGMEEARRRALAEAEQRIGELSSREDLHLVHAIQALDELDRFLNITTERTTEWYSLHFPELQDILRDNLVLSKLIAEIGKRGTFDKETLERKGLGEKKVEAILMASERSKGGTISDKDMNRLVGLSELSAKTAAEREKLAEYVEASMRKIAPNVTDVAGATIGARLIARAGGLDRLARLPASTIQVLGAEKALFRALRTGSRPPKHGILFQHEAVHMAPRWQRGKIARTIANKIAIAARIDYYRGEREGGLTDTLQKRLDEIKIKYKEPPPSRPERRMPRDGQGRQRPRFGKGRGKAGRIYKKPRPGQEGVRRGPPDRRG